ncbi:hypothetical protein, partial [Thiolapillus sp.]
MNMIRFLSVVSRVAFFTFSVMLSGGAASAKDMPAISHAAGETLAPQQLDFLFQPVELDALSVAARQRALDW